MASLVALQGSLMVSLAHFFLKPLQQPKDGLRCRTGSLSSLPWVAEQDPAPSSGTLEESKSMKSTKVPI